MQDINYKLTLKLYEIDKIIKYNHTNIYKNTKLLDIGFEIIDYLKTEYKSVSNIDKYYIWRTKKDDKVRALHAANNGKIFSLDNPPPTGNPGEEYGCRCWAEQIKSWYATQELITKIKFVDKRWNDVDFINHARNGNGRSITLSEIGHLAEIIYHVENKLDIYSKINKQIKDKVKNSYIEGNFINDTYRPYDFTPVQFSHGNSIIGSYFVGNIKKDGEFYTINGTISYMFYDEFTDPYDIRDFMKEYLNITDLPDWLVDLSDAFITPYTITGYWETRYKAVFK